MIRINVGLVIMLTDGFTGQAPSKEGFVFRVDGRNTAGIRKEDGFVAFTNVTPGEHVLSIRSERYLPVELPFTAGTEVIPVNLRPGPRYPYALGVRRITVEWKGKEEGFWLLSDSGTAILKFAQQEVSPGDTAAKLYQEGKIGDRLPGYFLAEGSKEPEIVMMTALNQEEACFPQGFKTSHKRGQALYSAQYYGKETAELVLSGKGKYRIYLPASGKLTALPEDAGTITI